MANSGNSVANPFQSLSWVVTSGPCPAVAFDIRLSLVRTDLLPPAPTQTYRTPEGAPSHAPAHPIARGRFGCLEYLHAGLSASHLPHHADPAAANLPRIDW